MMETESNESMPLDEKKKGISYVIKGNALKRKSEQTKKELATLQKEIAELEVKKKKWFYLYLIKHEFELFFPSSVCVLFSMFVRATFKAAVTDLISV